MGIINNYIILKRKKIIKIKCGAHYFPKWEKKIKNKERRQSNTLVEPPADSQKVTETLADKGFVHVVAADIGGTNARFVLARINYENESVEVVSTKKYPSANYKGLEEPMRVFLGEDNPDKIEADFCVIAIAGPVADGVAHITNVDWRKVSEKEIQEEFKLLKVCFINDFAAMGYGVITTPEDKMLNLTSTQPKEKAGKSIVGPGSGLGEAVLFQSPNQNQYDVHASEGGWSTFAPMNEEQWAIRNFIAKLKDTNTCSVEFLCNGPAFILIYKYYVSKFPKLPSVLPKEGENTDHLDEPKLIVDAALAKSNELAAMTVDTWIQVLFAECGNIGCKTLSYGGVFIVGGIIQAILPIVQESLEKYINVYYNKNAMEPHMRNNMPLYVVTNPNVGLDGSLEYGKRIAIGAQADNEVMNLYAKLGKGKAAKKGSQIWNK